MNTLKAWAEDKARCAAPQTLVEMMGTGRVLVECHKGIRSYGNQEILVGASYGCIRISGEGLRLCCMNREQLFISGRIDSLVFERSG